VVVVAGGAVVVVVGGALATTIGADVVVVVTGAVGALAWEGAGGAALASLRTAAWPDALDAVVGATASCGAAAAGVSAATVVRPLCQARMARANPSCAWRCAAWASSATSWWYRLRTSVGPGPEDGGACVAATTEKPAAIPPAATAPSSHLGTIRRLPFSHRRWRHVLSRSGVCMTQPEESMKAQLRLGCFVDASVDLSVRCASHRRAEPAGTHPDPTSASRGSPMEFSRELHDDIAAGDITVTFRLWKRPQAKVGGRSRAGHVEIEVDDITSLRFADITDTELLRIAFHVVG